MLKKIVSPFTPNKSKSLYLEKRCFFFLFVCLFLFFKVKERKERKRKARYRRKEKSNAEKKGGRRKGGRRKQISGSLFIIKNQC